ncbi:MAG: TIR domain-containing protein [Blastocatellia bacterium]|nr:TIR domain-containing protein [Blastocatellia bacterium]
MIQPDKPISLFISYSHIDELLRIELEKQLSALTFEGLDVIWTDRKIGAGQEWEREIIENLDAANVIVLLISSDFLASEYCRNVEMPRALQMHEKQQAIVIPVILRPCLWEVSPLAKIQAFPKDAKPVTTCPNRDEAWLDVVRGIRDALGRARSQPHSTFADDAGRAMPDRPLLPYLCDRSPQEGALSEGLRRHRETRDGRPIALLIHGNEQECHLEFIDRMQSRSIPKFLGLPSSQSVRRAPKSMRPPRDATAVGYWSMLGEALLENLSAGAGDLRRYLLQHQEPLLITLELLTGDLDPQRIGLIDAVTAFCEELPDLPPGRALILCVSMKYVRVGKPGFFDSRKRRLSRLNSDVRDGINGGRYAQRDRVSIIALPELEPIPRGDVEAWRSSESVRGCCSLTDAEIRAWYRDVERIPMEELAEKLRNAIR